MANWCYNEVRFFGNEEGLEKLEVILLIMEKLDKKMQQGEVHHPVLGIFQKNMFDIQLGELDGDLYLTYISRWVSNESEVIEIAEEAKVSFVYDAVEPASMIYQRCRYIPGGTLEYAVQVHDEFWEFDFDRDFRFSD